MSEPSPSVATLFDLLSHRRRRLIVLCVAGAPETGIPLRTLAETMYGFENDETPATAPTRSVTNLKTTIARSHLPDLRATGCVTQDSADRLHPGPRLSWAVAVIAVGMLGVDH